MGILRELFEHEFDLVWNILISADDAHVVENPFHFKNSG